MSRRGMGTWERKSGSLLTLTFLATAAAYVPSHAQVRSLRSDFIDRAVKTWDDDRLETGKESFSLVYDSIDTNSGSARLIGNAGAVGVQVIQTAEGLHFFEVTPSGNVSVTTVFSAKGVPAAHSRHTNLPGGPVVSQHHGHCRRY